MPLQLENPELRDLMGAYFQGALGMFLENPYIVSPSPFYVNAGTIPSANLALFQGNRVANTVVMNLHHDGSAHTGNTPTFQMTAETSVQTRSVFNILANFNNITDATRNSRVFFRTANAGTFATALSIVGGKVGIGTESPQTRLHVGAGTDAPDAAAASVLHVTEAGQTAITVRDSTNDAEVLLYVTGGVGLVGTRTNDEFRIRTNNTDAITIDTSQRVGLNAATPIAQLHIDQASTTGAIPVLLLDQADLSEEFIDFVTTVGAGNPVDTAAIGTYYGKARVAVNGTFKYVALYNS